MSPKTLLRGLAWAALEAGAPLQKSRYGYGTDMDPEVMIPCKHMGCCQNCGPFLGHLNTRCRIMLRTQKRTMILTTTHMWPLGRGVGAKRPGERCGSKTSRSLKKSSKASPLFRG